MKREPPDRQVLIKYLLGELSELERSAVAEWYFESDDLFVELLDVENDLLDKYVRSLLNETEREAFERYLRSLPDRQERVAVARAFMGITSEEAERAQQILNDYAPTSRFSGSSFIASFSRPRAILQYIVAASLTLAVMVLLFLSFQIRQMRNDNDQLRLRVDQLEREKESLEQSARNPQVNGGSDRIRQLEEQLNLEQQVNEAQAQRLARLQPTSPVIASWMLTPAMRSPNSPDKVTLPRSAQFVLISAPIEADEQLSSYRAIIQTTTGEQRREEAGLRANKISRAISLKLPAEYFTETTYKLTLVGRDRDGVELARDYYFTVTRN